MNQSNRENHLLEAMMQISNGIDVKNEEILLLKNKALESISRSEANLKSYLEELTGRENINFQQALSNLTVPETKQIESLAENHSFEEDGPVSGLIQISQNKILIYKDKTLKSKPKLILEGFAQSLKSHPDRATQIFTQIASSDEEPLSTFCAAASRHGAFVYIPESVNISNSLIIDIDADSFAGQIAPLYLLIFIERNASANVFLNLSRKKPDDQSSILAIQLEVLLNHSSKLNFYEIQNLSNHTDLAFNEAIKVSENASINYFGFDSGGLTVDRRLKITLEEEFGEAQITGLYKPGHQSRYLYSTSQYHNASYTKSDLLYKGVLDGEANVKWNGNIYVKKNTKGVDGYQMNNNLLASNKVRVNSIPGLEILTDDVRCSHGVTISDIDKNQRLYLQSRGINQEDSELLIIEGFFQKALERISDSKLSEKIRKNIPGSMEDEF